MTRDADTPRSPNFVQAMGSARDPKKKDGGGQTEGTRVTCERHRLRSAVLVDGSMG